MELGGVGRPPVLFFAGAGLAASLAGCSWPESPSRGLGMLTDSVIPARARAMLDLRLLPVGAMVGELEVCLEGLESARLRQPNWVWEVRGKRQGGRRAFTRKVACR